MKVSNKEITCDINKIKDIRRKIRDYADDNLEFLKEEAEFTESRLKLIEIESIVLTGLGFIFGNIVLSSIIALVFLFRLYFNGKKLDSYNECYFYEKAYRDKFLSLTENFIEDHEQLLEFRKNREIDKEMVKNLNICFGFENDYDYDLKKLNDKYKNCIINREDEKYNDLSFININTFYSTIEDLYEIEEENKIEKKLVLHDDFRNR